MNFRLTAIFFAIVLALVVGLLVLVLTDSGPGTLTGEALLQEFAGYKEKDIDTIEMTRTSGVSNAEEKLVFIRSAGSQWALKEPFAAKVDSLLLDNVVRELFAIKPTLYGDLTDNLTLHGLDKPTFRIVLKKGDRVSGLNLGFSNLGSRPVAFVTTMANPKRSLAVLRNDIGSLFRDSAAKQEGEGSKLAKWLPDYRVRKPLGSEVRDAAMEASTFKVTQGPAEIAFDRPTGSSWKFTNPATFGDAEEVGDSAVQQPTAAFTGVRPLLNALSSMQVASVEDYLENPGDLATYGLKPGDPNIVRVEFKTRSGVDVISLGKPVEVAGKPTSPAKVYAKLDGDPGVMLVTFDKYDAIKATLKNPAELRNKDLLAESQKTKIDAFDLAFNKTVMKFRKVSVLGDPGTSWVIYGGPTPVFAKASDVESLLTVITRPRVAKEVLSSPYDAVFTEAEKKGTLTVWRDGLAGLVPAKLEPGQLPPEPAVKGTPAEFIFGKIEADNIFVRRNVDGKTADVKLAETIMSLVAKPRSEWIDPKWKSFVTTSVSRVTFNRGAEAYDIERDASNQWVFAKPEAMKGKFADADRVDAIVGRLSTLACERVISEAPTPDELKKFNLDLATPRVRVTLALKDPADKERSYDFGAETEDKKSVFVRIAGKPMISTVVRGITDMVLNEDLRDSLLYRVDAAKVKKLKIRGWKAATGALVVYDLEKTSGTWKAITPTGVTLDNAKVDALVQFLAKPKVDQYIGLPVAEHGVSVDTNPAAFEFTLESDGAPTVALVTGNLAEGGRHFVTASTTTNLIGVINAAAMLKFIEKPTNLHK
jgi:hypothetical protein